MSYTTTAEYNQTQVHVAPAENRQSPLDRLNAVLSDLENKLTSLDEMVERGAGNLGCPAPLGGLVQSEGPVEVVRPMQEVIRRVDEMSGRVVHIQSRLHETLSEVINL